MGFNIDSLNCLLLLNSNKQGVYREIEIEKFNKAKAT